MVQLMKVLPCANCGSEIEIAATDVLPIRKLEPANKCKECGALANILAWFSWSWAAKQLIDELCNEEQFRAFRKSPIEQARKINDRLRKEKGMEVIFISGDAQHPIFTTNKDRLKGV